MKKTAIILISILMLAACTSDVDYYELGKYGKEVKKHDRQSLENIINDVESLAGFSLTRPEGIKKKRLEIMIELSVASFWIFNDKGNKYQKGTFDSPEKIKENIKKQKENIKRLKAETAKTNAILESVK
ncbi:MAG: hypothetical protein PF445_12555 [Melioribacteraceae bacterium]|jgi:hypothetical protein|nr:hypothetical protein [Melioribacteraceae bacterium]